MASVWRVGDSPARGGAERSTAERERQVEDMKQFGWIMALLALVVLVFALNVARPHKRPALDCTNKVLVIKAPHGEPRECDLQARAVSSIFTPYSYNSCE